MYLSVAVVGTEPETRTHTVDSGITARILHSGQAEGTVHTQRLTLLTRSTSIRVILLA